MLATQSLGGITGRGATILAVIEEGNPAPDFELESDSGETVKLSDLRGKPVVLYFYPKDDTPGCTTQACGIRDAGPSSSGPARWSSGSASTRPRRTSKFSSKYSLPFTLLADPEHTLAEPTASGQEGKETYARSTFVIDADGNVTRIMRRVKPDRHADQVLAGARRLGGFRRNLARRRGAMAVPRQGRREAQ